MTEAIIILQNMRGGCATVGDKVHTLFRVTARGRRSEAMSDSSEKITRLAAALALEDCK